MGGKKQKKEQEIERQKYSEWVEGNSLAPLESNRTQNNLLFSFPSNQSTPVMNFGHSTPFLKGNDNVSSEKNTPTLKERISPFSFRGEHHSRMVSESKIPIPSFKKRTKKITKSKACNCLKTNCQSTKCRCQRNGNPCNKECGCKKSKCLNLQKSEPNLELSFQNEFKKEKSDNFLQYLPNSSRSPLLKRINDQDSIVLLEEPDKRFFVCKKTETLDSFQVSNFPKNCLKKNLKKINL